MFYVKLAAIFFGTLGYAMIVNIPKKHLIYIGITAMTGFAVYQLLLPSEVFGCFMGACVIAAFSEFFSRTLKDAATLFIIPGIIKGFAYSMVPYILAENPNLSPKQIINISCRMTKGYKLKIFFTSLSFIGWYLLGAMAFGIGTVFVVPYERATFAQLYLAIRSDALDSGRVSLAELEYGL